MPRLLLGLLLVGLIFWGFRRLRPQLRSALGQRRVRAGLPWLLAAALAAVLSWRFGYHWLVVLGSLLIGAVRRLLPLLRYLPFLRGLGIGGRAGPGASSGGGWAGGGAPHPGPGDRPGSSGRPSGMTRREALDVLGLDEQASRDDVKREYNRLMKKMHPDVGGSTYLAAKLNQAREVLLS